MAERLKASALAARVPAAGWTTATATSMTESWFTVLEFNGARNELVIVAAGEWAWTSTSADGRVRLHGLRPPDIVGVLPLLELEPAGLEIKLAGPASVLQIATQELVAALPTAELFAAAFESRSDYWIDRALRWLESALWPVPPSKVLQAVIDDSRISQSIRHRSQKVLWRVTR